MGESHGKASRRLLKCLNMYPVLFHVFGQAFTSWPLFALTGAWVFYFVVRRELLKNGISRTSINIFTFSCVITFFIGGHLGQLWTVGHGIAVAAHPRFSGFMLYGGVLVAGLSGIACWKLLGWNRILSLRKMLDMIVPAMFWALFFGRIGCTLYGCCYGTPSNGFPGYVLNYQHWDFGAQIFPHELRGVELHPAPLYEALLLLLLALWGGQMKNRLSLPPAILGWSLLGSYALGRFFLEWIRMDARGNFSLGLSPSQWISIGLLVLAGFFLQRAWREAKVLS